MNLSFETIIVGSGLGGACVAAALSADGTDAGKGILIVDGGNGSTGVKSPASATGSGISSPLMSRRARPVWRMEAAVSALCHLVKFTDATSLFSNNGILKLAQSPDQAVEFRDASSRWPRHGRWLETNEVKNRQASIRAPFGALHVLTGHAVSLPAWSRHLTGYAINAGAQRVTNARMLSWREHRGIVTVNVRSSSAKERAIVSFTTSRLILAPGADYLRFCELAALNLHPIKGAWVRVVRPEMERQMIPVTGAGYVIKNDVIDNNAIDNNAINNKEARPSLSLGSTFEHHYRHMRPTSVCIQEMISNAASMIPSLEQSIVLESGAAVRVTVPGIRLPMVGPLKKGSNVWIFSGLGSKGVLMAPMLALNLREYFTNPASIPKEIRVTYR